MPSINENIKEWNDDYDWHLDGELWSKAWGGSAAQWYGCIYPRVRRFLPASVILEIAPGFGRWTEFLLPHCDTLIGIDVSPKCIEACRRRFADHRGARFESNDGRSISMVADSSIDLAFSFDSLVHVEAEVIADYLGELARVLKPDGIAFLHHSNYGAYERSSRALAPIQPAFRQLPSRIQGGLGRAGIFRERGNGWRASSVSAARFAGLCDDAGMSCIGQELINWAGGALLLDCISVVTPAQSRWDRSNCVVKNWLFRAEARSVRRSLSAYEDASSPLGAPHHQATWAGEPDRSGR